MYSVYPTHSYYQAPFAHRNNYKRALAKARTAELAEAAALREEEELLQYRLDQLRRADSQSFAHPSVTYPYYNQPSRYANSLESLRLQIEEEEMLKELEALRQRRRQFELEQERLKELENLRQHQFQLKLEKEIAVSSRPRLETPPFLQEERLRRNYIEPPSAVLNQYGFDCVLQDQQSYGRHVCAHIKPNVYPQHRIFCRCEREQIPVMPPALRPLQPRHHHSYSRMVEPSLCNLQEAPRRCAESPTHVSGLEKIFEKFLGDQRCKAVPSGTKEAGRSQLFGIAGNTEKPHSRLATAPAKRQELNGALLKTQLEKRLRNENSKEIQDTIQTLLFSISDSAPISTSSTSLPSVSVNRASQATPTPTPGKGKAKEAPINEEGSKIPSSIDIDAAMGRILSIERQFVALENEFDFPENVDFVPTGSLPPHATSDPVISHLAFTANNQPIRMYEQTLNHLLAELDSIESYGNEPLRKNRKDIVGKVEHALEDLEQLVEGRWNAKVARESKYKVTIEDLTPSEVFLSSIENSLLTTTSVLEPIIPGVNSHISLSQQEPQEAKQEESVSEIAQKNTDIFEEPLANSGPSVSEVAHEPQEEQLVDVTKDDLVESLEVLGEAVDSNEAHSTATHPSEDAITTPSNTLVSDSRIDMDATIRPSTATEQSVHIDPALSTLDDSSSPSTISSPCDSAIELDLLDNNPDDGGFLMENVLVDDGVDHKAIDGDSTSSDWLEVNDQDM